ncbi:MAG TPA: helix-turn-helix transcriptional regulator, partial [Candidatus Limnocylindrales bacterium]|nr:helix-turn-helix transcriptional regulator [Candidatus Limnocylindrales bacterium]
MDGQRLGSDLRLLRVRRRWRQEDLAARAGCSQAQISRVERGLISSVPIGKLDAIAAALGARFVGTVLWQGERLDRLRDERHAALVDAIVRLLQADGWLVAPEVSFAVFGERGSIDVLAFHPGTRILLVIEVKTAFGDVQATLGTLDRKERL